MKATRSTIGVRATWWWLSLLAATGAGAQSASIDGCERHSLEAPATERILDRGRRFTQRFYADDLEALWRAMTDDLRRTLGSRAALEAFRANVLDAAGRETDVLEEYAREESGLAVYRRLAQFSAGHTPVRITFGFDDRERIAALRIEPVPRAAPSPHLDYRTKARLRLPFDGEWLVFWGGRSVEQNYHAASPDQRFAYDFVVRREGQTHREPGARNSDYYCWDRPVLAPAPGRVVAAVDEHADRPPGMPDPEHPAGNHVVLDLGRGEYAVLAHLRSGSVRARVGERVAGGEILGACGNSGNTTEPHLHFHLQDGPVVGMGRGLPAFFSAYVADGMAVARGEPVRCQAVTDTD